MQGKPACRTCTQDQGCVGQAKTYRKRRGNAECASWCVLRESQRDEAMEGAERQKKGYSLGLRIQTGKTTRTDQQTKRRIMRERGARVDVREGEHSKGGVEDFRNKKGNLAERQCMCNHSSRTSTQVDDDGDNTQYNGPCRRGEGAAVPGDMWWLVFCEYVFPPSILQPLSRGKSAEKNTQRGARPPPRSEEEEEGYTDPQAARWRLQC